MYLGAFSSFNPIAEKQASVAILAIDGGARLI